MFISLFVISFFGALQSIKAQTDPTLLFAKGLGNDYIGGGDLSVSSIKIDASGNRYITGYFKATADFDPSSATANLVSSGGADIFIAKYDATGNYIWAKGMGGTSDEWGNSLVFDGGGNVYVTGYFFGTVDFDPSSITANLISAGVQDIFVAKYDASGNYIWAKGMGGTGEDIGKSLALDGSDNVYVTGYFSGTVDFDPSSSTANLVSAGSTDIFFAKYDASGNYIWSKGVGGAGIDVANSLALDGSSNVYVTGYFNSTADFDPSSSTDNLVSAGGTDIFFAKYDASGNYIWSKGMGGASNDQGYSLALDGSGNVFVTGFFYGTADFDPGSSTVNLVSGGNVDVFVAKYNASGSYVWAKPIGAAGNDYGTSLVLDGSNVVVTGYFSGTVDFDPSSTATANLTSAGSNDMFVAKYDASGNYLWAKGMGGTDNDQGLSLALNGSDNVLVTGKFSGTADFDPSAGTANLVAGTGTNSNGFISSYTIASGTYNSALLLGGYTLATSVRSNAIVKDGKGNIYLTGYFSGTVDFDPSSTATANMTSAGNDDIFIAKYDASGNYVWAKGMGGTGTDNGNSLALDNSGNVFVTGSFNSTADFDPSSNTANLVSAGYINVFFAKFDASGNYVWAKRIGGTLLDFGNSLTLDGSGNVYVTGLFYGTADFDPGSSTANLESAGGYDIFVSKYDASGNYIWAKGMGGTGEDKGNSLALDGSDNVFVTGIFNGTADFDPSSTATANLESAGSDDIFVAKYDASGNYVWAKGMGGTGYDQGKSLALDGSGNVFVTGIFYGTADFDPSSSTANLESAGSDDIFVAKYDASGNYVWAKSMGGTGEDIGNSLALDGSSNVFVTGYFGDTADFDPSCTATANLESVGNADVFVSKYDALGNYVWAQGMGGTGDDIGNSLALGGSGNVFVTGFFNTTADFDPSSSTYNLTSMSGSFGFFAAYVTCSNPTSGGTIATAQSGTSPFDPADFTSSSAAIGETGSLEYKWQS